MRRQVTWMNILSDSKFPQIFRTLLSAMVWIVSILPLISSFLSLFSRPFGIVPRSSIIMIIYLLFYSMWSFYTCVSWWSKWAFYDLNCSVAWIVSILLLITSFPSLFSRPLGTIQRTSATISITVTFYSFFNSLARSRYLSKTLTRSLPET